MNTRILSLAAAAVMSFSAGAMAQTVAGSADAVPAISQSTVGHWIYDAQGNAIGSVSGLTDGGRTAVVMIGSYFRPGSYETQVPAHQLTVADGRLTLETGTMQALNATAGR